MTATARRARLATVALSCALAWAVAGALLPPGLPAGVIVRGLLTGIVVALPTAGLVLAYQATRVVNLAQAQLGVVGAVLAVELRLAWRVPYPVALVAGVATAAVIGAAVEVLVLRRLRAAPSLVSIVATAGVAQLLTGLALLLDERIDVPLGRFFTPPVDWRFTVEPITFDGGAALLLTAGAAALVALAVLLGRTDLGLALRALASDRERTSLAGVPAGLYSAAAWGLAGALSGLALVLRAPTLGTATAVAAAGTGTSLLLRTLAAAAIGRFTDLPRAVGAALAIGVVEETIAWWRPNTTVVDALLVVMIVGALLVQGRAIGRLATGGLAGWRSAGAGRPLAPSAGIRRGLLTAAVAAAALPAFLGPAHTETATLVLIQAIVVVSLVVLVGWTGELSLGQFAVAGTGGAVVGVLHGRHGLDLLLALPVGMAVAAAVLALLLLPSLRGGGLLGGIATLGFAVAAGTYLFEARYVGWLVEDRLVRPALWGRLALDRPWQLYLLALAALAAVTAAATNLRRSRTGRALLAVRDNASSAAAAGIAEGRTRVFGIVASGAVAGLAGSLYVLHQQGLHGESFTPEASLRLLAVAVVGGLASVPGAIAAAVVFGAADHYLPLAWSLLSSGIGMLGVLLFLPGGIGGLLERLARAGPLRGAGPGSRAEPADSGAGVRQ